MGNHQPPPIENEVMRETSKEVAHTLLELWRLALELLHGHLEAVRDLHGAPLEVAQQFSIVVPEHHRSPTTPARGHDQTQHRHDLGPTIDEVPDEEQSASVRMRELIVDVSGTCALFRYSISESLEKFDEFVEAPVNISDDIERSAPPAPVTRQRLPNNDSPRCFLRTFDPVPALEGFFTKSRSIVLELSKLPLDDCLTDMPTGSLPIVSEIDLLRVVEDDRNTWHVVTTSEFEQRKARFASRVGRIDNREPTTAQASFSDLMKNCERFARCRLIGFIVCNHRPEGIGRENLSGTEVRMCERRLSRTRGTDQQHEREGRDDDASPPVLRSRSLESCTMLHEAHLQPPGNSTTGHLASVRAHRYN